MYKTSSECEQFFNTPFNMAPRGVSSHLLPSLISVASSGAQSTKKIFKSVKKVITKGATATTCPFKKSCKSQASDALSIDENEDLNSEHPLSLIAVDESQYKDKQAKGKTDDQELSELNSPLFVYKFSQPYQNISRVPGIHLSMDSSSPRSR